MKKWSILSVVLFCLLLFSPSVTKAAERSTIDISLECGFKGNVKTGSCLPVQITLENRGEAFKGMLEMEVPVQAENQDVYSSIWMNGNNRESNKNRVYTYQKEITLEKGETKKETFYLELPIFEGGLHVRVKEGKTVVSTAEINSKFSENSSRILVGIVSKMPDGISELDGMLVDIAQGYVPEAFVKTILLEPEEIYPNPDALNQLDLLIADKDSAFSQEQRTALTRWRINGGFYLERNGEHLVELFQKMLNGEQREKFQNHLEQMQTYYFGETGGVDRVPVSRKPSMGVFLFILVGYVVMAGPGLFLILKKKKKQKYLWAGICGMSVLFTGIIWMIGKQTSISAPFISYCGLYEQQDNVWSEVANIGIQAPYNYKYQLYLDSEYRLLPIGMGSTGGQLSRSESAEKVNIRLGEKKNKVTIENMSSFTQNFFKLEKNKMLTDEETIQLKLVGDGENLEGTWENPTKYSIRNAVLVMKNRAAVLGKLPAGSQGEIADAPLYSCGIEGMKVLLQSEMDFSDFAYPEYEVSNLEEQTWSVMRNENPKQAYLLGIVENPDLEFQENSGYKVFGSALLKMPVNVKWEKDGYYWCPNLEAYGESQIGEFSAETNLMYGKEATVDYHLKFPGNVKEITLFNVEYDEEKYYFPFQGHIAFYSWESGRFEEIHEWNRTLQEEELQKYLSATGVIRIRYLLEDTLNTRERSCMLPCLEAIGKVG